MLAAGSPRSGRFRGRLCTRFGPGTCAFTYEPGVLEPPRHTPGVAGASARSNRPSAPSPWVRRSRKSASTLWWKPGSSSSMARAYVESMRQRTASAACRSDRSSRNCRTQTVASWVGERSGRPSRGYQSAKSSSHRSPSSRSLTHIAVVPPGLLARAVCTVKDGTCSPERGRRDNGCLDNCIGLRNSLSMPADQASAPGNSKIPGRVRPRHSIRRQWAAERRRNPTPVGAVTAATAGRLGRLRRRQSAAWPR